MFEDLIFLSGRALVGIRFGRRDRGSPVSGTGGKYPISDNGGSFPIWSPNGRELFYLTNDNQIMAVAYNARGGVFAADKPHPWAEARTRFIAGRGLALSPDGKHFAVIAPAGNAPQQQGQTVSILLNFFDELRRRVPVGGK